MILQHRENEMKYPQGKRLHSSLPWGYLHAI